MDTNEKTTAQPKDIWCFEMAMDDGETKIFVEVVNYVWTH